jgi:hypothetical protein
VHKHCDTGTAKLKTELSSGQVVYTIHCGVNMLVQRRIHVLGGTYRGGMRFHHAVQNVRNLKLINYVFVEKKKLSCFSRYSKLYINLEEENITSNTK